MNKKENLRHTNMYFDVRSLIETNIYIYIYKGFEKNILIMIVSTRLKTKQIKKRISDINKEFACLTSTTYVVESVQQARRQRKGNLRHDRIA